MREREGRSYVLSPTDLPEPEATGRKPRRRWSRLPCAFHDGRHLFGPHDLRENRIRAEDYRATDLSPAARRALREGAEA